MQSTSITSHKPASTTFYHSDNSEWPSDITSQSPILTESAAELMEVFREKSNHEGVVSVYEAMKTRGVTPGARVCHYFLVVAV